MAAVEERVSSLEGRSVEQSNVFAGIYTTLGSLDQRMISLEHRLDGRILSLEQRMDRRFEQVELRLTAMDQKIDVKAAGLEHKLDQRFAWLIGLQITTILAFVGAVVAFVKH